MLEIDKLSSAFILQNETSVGEFINKVCRINGIRTNDYIQIEYKGKFGYIKINKRFATSSHEIRFVIFDTTDNSTNIYTISIDKLSRKEQRDISLDLHENNGQTFDKIALYLGVGKTLIRNITANKTPRIRMTKK